MIVLKVNNETGKVIDSYNTLREAAENVSSSLSSIRGACVNAHRGHKVKGYRWIAINKATERSHYSHIMNENGIPLTLEEINQRVFERRKNANETRQRNISNRPKTLKLVCNKCNSIGKLNKHTTLISLKEEDNFMVSVTADHKIIFKCCVCDTEIAI